MAANDVEVRITGNVDSSLTSSINTAKMTIDELGKAASSGKITIREYSDAVSLLSNNLRKNTEEEVKNTGAKINSRAAYESLVLVHEALMGRYTRMVPSAMILTQSMAGQAATANFLSAALNPVVLGVAAVTAAMAAGVVAAMQYEAEMRKMEASVVGLGATSGHTSQQLMDLAQSGMAHTKESISDVDNAVMEFNSAGIKNIGTIDNMKETYSDFATLTGQKTTAAVKELAEALKDPAKGVDDLKGKLSFLTGAEIEQIKTLVELGEKEEAAALLTQKLKDYDDAAVGATQGFTSGIKEFTSAVADAWQELGKLVDKLLHYLALAGSLGSGAQQRAFQDEITQAQRHGNLAEFQAGAESRRQSAAGAELFDKTPEGVAMHRRIELMGDVRKAQAALAQDKPGSDSFKRDKQTLEEYTYTLKSFRSEHERKIANDNLEAQIAVAKHHHNAALVAQLAQQKALLTTGAARGEVESQAQAEEEARGAGALAGARTFPKGGGRHGPGIVAQWTEELHQQEVASGDFFKDQSATELAFWNEKLGQVRRGSREYIEIKAKIYELDKKAAHDSYADQIATYNEQLEANKENWSQEQTVWEAKLKYIADHFGKEGKEYKDAYKEFEAATREHEKVMRDIEREANDEAVRELKNTLATQRTIRENDAREAESEIQYRAKYSGNPLAQVQAEQQIAALHRQVAQQNLQDMEQEHVAQDKLLQDDINAAHEGTLEYQKAVDAKKLADLQWANQHRQLMDQMVNQERSDAQRIQESWHSIVDPMVQSTGTQIKGLIEGTETWGQALRNIGEEALNLIVDAIERIVEQWIVQMIAGKTATSTTAIGNIAAYAAEAGAAGVASFAGAPWPIDTGAPAFGAAMSAAALSYTALASLDVGTNYVNRDQVAKIHEGERIMPKADNTALMAALSGVTGGPSRHGDFHGDFGVHMYGLGDPASLDGRKLVKALEGAQSHFSKLLKTMHRNGKFSYAG